MFTRIPVIRLQIKSFLGIFPSRTIIDVRVRFAPSPTGFMHIGGLRTALINHLFASKQKGVFILRIEDTDKTRFHPDSVTDILRCLEWANLLPSEGPHIGGPFGPYVQSERAHLYTQIVDQLVKSGNAYPCFCTPRRLELMRNEQFRRKETYRYDNRCRNLSSSEVESRLSRREPYTIRFKVENSAKTVNDIVFGQVTFDNDETEGDFEWLSSTPKHLRLYEALGWSPPEFAHLPLLLSSSGGKLSKRSAEFSLIGLARNLAAAGHLPSAVLTWLTSVGFGGRQRSSSRELGAGTGNPRRGSAVPGVAGDAADSATDKLSPAGAGEDVSLPGWSPHLEYQDLVSRFDVNSISRQNVHLSVDLLRICGRAHFDRLVSTAYKHCSGVADKATQPPTGPYQSPVLLAGLRKYAQTYHSNAQLPPGSPEGDRQLVDRLHSLRGRIHCFSDLFSADTGVSALWQQPSPPEVLSHLLQQAHRLPAEALQRLLACLLKHLPAETKSLESLGTTVSCETGVRKPDVMRILRVCLTGHPTGLPIVQLVDLLTAEEAVKRLQLVHGELGRHLTTEQKPPASPIADSPPQ